MSGGTWKRRRPPPVTSRGDSTASIPSSFSTPPDQRANPRASCTPAAATWSAPTPPANTSSTCGTTTSTGAPPMWAGSPGIPTSSTARSPTGPPRSCMRELQTTPTSAASGKSWRNTASPFSIPPPPPSVPSSRPATSFPTPTTSPRCACSARWASPSIRRPGCGITKRSAAAAARSSTPGGRPKPAPS